MEQYRRSILRILLLGLILAACSGLALAVAAASANYQLTLDALTGGGGPASSATYIESQSAVGQETPGLSLSANYRDEGGIVQNLSAPNSASDWLNYP